MTLSPRNRTVSPTVTVIVGSGGFVGESRWNSKPVAKRFTFTSVAAAGVPKGTSRSTTSGRAREQRTRVIAQPHGGFVFTGLPRIASRSKALYPEVRIDARNRAMSWVQSEIRELKVNRYVLVDEEPCKILSIQTSKPGKHGEAKARLEVVGIFDGQRRSIVHPVTHKVKVPVIDKRKAQILSVQGATAQLMDLQTYETFEMPIPEEMGADVKAGGEILYMEAMGRRQMTRP